MSKIKTIFALVAVMSVPALFGSMPHSMAGTEELGGSSTFTALVDIGGNCEVISVGAISFGPGAPFGGSVGEEILTLSNNGNYNAVVSAFGGNWVDDLQAGTPQTIMDGDQTHVSIAGGGDSYQVKAALSLDSQNPTEGVATVPAAGVADSYWDLEIDMTGYDLGYLGPAEQLITLEFSCVAP